MPVLWKFYDTNEEVIAALKKHMGSLPCCEFHHAGILQGMPVDAVVSPANSLGIMDGGIDGLYTKWWGNILQERLQYTINHHFDGELPVGQVVGLQFTEQPFNWLLSAPTMRTPRNISNTLNVHDAFMGLIRTISNINASPSHSAWRIKTVACPGLGTGSGGVSPESMARQMRVAYDKANNGKRTPDFYSYSLLEDWMLCK